MLGLGFGTYYDHCADIGKCYYDFTDFQTLGLLVRYLIV